MNLNKTLLRTFLFLSLTLFPLSFAQADTNNSKTASVVTVTRSLRIHEPKAVKGDMVPAEIVQIPSGQISYHNGQVMTVSPNIYFIWYGNWDLGPESTPGIITEFITNLGGSPYARINTTYSNRVGQHPSGGLIYGGSVVDRYSHGTALSRADVEAVINDFILHAGLPLDPNGMYFVFGSADVTADGFCTETCEFHDQFSILGTSTSYAFVGNPERCPYQCASQFNGTGNFLPTPNGNLAADAMASWIAHDVSGIITDTRLDGWYINPLIYGQQRKGDRQVVENSDLCEDQFGLTYTTPNGARANMHLGSRDYLIQQNWVNADGGYCALAYP